MQPDIRSFFGSNAAASAKGKKPTPSVKTESRKSEEKDAPAPSKPSASKPRRQTPAKAKEPPAKGRKGVAVAKKKTVKAKQPAKAKTPSKGSRKKRSWDEREEYDSDFVTSSESDESEKSEDEFKQKQKGPKRIVCSDNESDTEIMKIDRDEADGKTLVNQTITKFVSLINDKHQATASKKASAPVSIPRQEISSKDFFGASSKPKLIKASSATPSAILLSGSTSSVAQTSNSVETFDATGDGDMAIESVDVNAILEPSVSRKENIVPVDTVRDQNQNIESNSLKSIEPTIPPPEPLAVETKSSKPTVSVPTTVSDIAAKKWRPGQQRAAPKLLGQKTIPKGEPNCLAGKRFVLTGVLESLERDACSDLIKSLGGY